MTSLCIYFLSFYIFLYFLKKNILAALFFHLFFCFLVYTYVLIQIYLSFLFKSELLTLYYRGPVFFYSHRAQTFSRIFGDGPVKADTLKILAMYRRPVRQVAATIGAWLNIFQLLIDLNSSIIMHQLHTSIVFIHDREGNWSKSSGLAAILIMEHLPLLIKFGFPRIVHEQLCRCVGFIDDASTSGAGDLAKDEDEAEDEEILLPTLEGKVDPADLAFLPPSVQLDLLVQNGWWQRTGKSIKKLRGLTKCRK
uniref:Putative anoctamin n=1 Tax=Helianthus annuus TaxID=4232 RepID=A0A251UMI3_HELAN